MRNSLARLILLTALVGVAGTVNGEVTRVEIAKRTDVGTSGYEKIIGTIHFAVDPGHPRNRVIVDLDAAKKNAGRTRGILRRPLHPASARSGAVQRRCARRGLESRAQESVEHVQPRPRRARSVEGRRSRRRVPDAAGLHAGLGRVAVRRAAAGRADEARRAGIHRQRHRARRVHAQRSRAGTVAGRPRRLLTRRSGGARRDAHGSQRSVRNGDDDPPRPVAAAGQQRRLDRRRIRAGPDVRNRVSSGEPARGRCGPRRVSRHGVVDQVPVRRDGEREARVHLRVFAKRPLPPRVPLLRVQQRRAGPAGLRRRDGPHRGSRASEPQRGAGSDAKRAVDVQRDEVSFLRRPRSAIPTAAGPKGCWTTIGRARTSRRFSTRTRGSSTGAAAARPRSFTRRSMENPISRRRTTCACTS